MAGTKYASMLESEAFEGSPNHERLMQVIRYPIEWT